jgi:hypothetical protein
MSSVYWNSSMQIAHSVKAWLDSGLNFVLYKDFMNEGGAGIHWGKRERLTAKNTTGIKMHINKVRQKHLSISTYPISTIMNRPSRHPPS